MKRSFLLTVICFFLLTLSSCAKKAGPANEEVTLVMAEVNPEGTIAGQMDQVFKEKVEELSGGKIKIDLHCSGILGDVDSVMALMMKPNSTIQIHRMSAVNMAMYGCKKTSLLSVPFTFSSKEHFWRFVNSAEGQELLNEPSEIGLGLKGLFFGEEGFRHFFSTKKLQGIEDFKSLKIRGTNDETMQGILKGLQADSIPVNYADLYSALQTGLIDAAEQPIANYLANHFYEVAPHMIFDGHTLGVMETIITEEAWNSLSEEQQAILLEAGKYASESCKKISETEEDKVKAQLIEKGASLTEVKNRAPWQEACSDVIKKGSLTDSVLYEQIMSYADQD